MALTVLPKDFLITMLIGLIYMHILTLYLPRYTWLFTYLLIRYLLNLSALIITDSHLSDQHSKTNVC